MDTRAEELMLSIETTLYKVTEKKLQETADYLQIGDIEGLSKRALIRNIRDYLDELQCLPKVVGAPIPFKDFPILFPFCVTNGSTNPLPRHTMLS